MALTKDDIAELDELLEVSGEIGPQWAEELLGVVDEELEPEEKKGMVEDGLDDEDTQDAICGILAIKGLYLAYRQALSEIEDPEARAYIRSAIETAPPVVIGGEEDAKPTLTVVKDEPPPPSVPAPPAVAPQAPPLTIPKAPKLKK